MKKLFLQLLTVTLALALVGVINNIYASVHPPPAPVPETKAPVTPPSTSPAEIDKKPALAAPQPILPTHLAVKFFGCCGGRREPVPGYPDE